MCPLSLTLQMYAYVGTAAPGCPVEQSSTARESIHSFPHRRADRPLRQSRRDLIPSFHPRGIFQ
jgi:hypothetical protein